MHSAQNVTLYVTIMAYSVDGNVDNFGASALNLCGEKKQRNKTQLGVERLPLFSFADGIWVLFLPRTIWT